MPFLTATAAAPDRPAARIAPHGRPPAGTDHQNEITRMGVGRILRIVDDDVLDRDAEPAGGREHPDQRFPERGEDVPE